MLPPEDLPNTGIKPKPPTLQANSLPSEPPGKTKMLEWVAYPFAKGLSHPGVRLGSPALQADSLPAELPGKPPHLLTHIYSETH